MARADSIGLFWEDIVEERGKRVRPMPEIPDTGWRPPTFFPDLSGVPAIGLDLETWDPNLLTKGPGWARNDGHIVGVSVSVPDGNRWYFPIRHTVQPEYNMDPEAVLAWLRDTLGNPKQHKVGANIIYDVGWLLQEGVPVLGPLHDVQHMAALLTENELVGLEHLGQRWLGEGKDSPDLYRWMALAYGGNPGPGQRKNIYRAPPCLVGPYAESDASLPLRLMSVLWPKLQAEGLVQVYEMETALTPLLIKMRFTGVKVDVGKAEEVYDVLGKRQAEEQHKLDKAAGTHVEVDAAASIAKAFDMNGLPYQRTLKGAPSFTKSFLAGVGQPISKQILEVRRLAKLRNTFIKGYIIDSNVNGRVHGQFHQLRGDEGGTRSGRLSSSDPNLQNLPIRDEELGPLVRSMFVPEDGHKDWAKIDLSQIEYRFLVHFAVGGGAEEARNKYRDDPRTDYHDMTIALIKQLTGHELSRKPAKNINFGLIYGMGTPKLAEDLRLSPKEAKILFGAYHTGVPFAKATMQAAIEEAEQNGTVRTIMGRLSRFELYQPATRGRTQAIALPFARAQAAYGGSLQLAHTHKALNRKLQGSAADCMKMAMVKADAAGLFDVLMPRLTVHDELDFSVPDTREAEEALLEIKHIMETALTLSVPIIAELDRGANWGHCG